MHSFMREGINEPVSVLASYNHKTNTFRPIILTWKSIDYRLGKIDFQHKTKQGLVTLHHFYLSDIKETIYFKLMLDASNLTWTLQEYMMAESSHVVYS